MKEYFNRLHALRSNVQRHPLAVQYNRQYQMDLRNKGFIVIQPGKKYDNNKENIFVSLHETPYEINDQMPIFHKHDFFELVYVYKGFSICRFEDSSITMKANNALMLRPNILHRFNLSGKHSSSINIHIQKDIFFNNISPIISDIPRIRAFTSPYASHSNLEKDYIFFPIANDSNHPIVESICREFINKKHMYQTSLLALIAYLLSQLACQSMVYYDMQESENEFKDRVLTILDYIETNCTTVSLQDLEKEFSYTTSYLSRMIKQNTGQTFTEIQTHFRLQKAKKLLEISNMSVCEVGFESGYSDIQYFSQKFKKKYGKSPLNYRKSLGMHLCHEYT